MAGPTPAGQRITLSDILDQDALQRICMGVARLHRTGVALLERDGRPLLDIPAEHAVCRRLTGMTGGGGLCSAACDPMAPAATTDEPPCACACGLRFERVRLGHDGVPLGEVLLGPYRPAGLDELPAELADTLGVDAADAGARGGLARAAEDLRRLPEMDRQEARQVVLLLGEILSMAIRNGYARHFTTEIHIAALQDAYDEVTRKNRELAASVEKLKELDELKSGFLAIVSHELRTPLTSVIGYSEMLLEGLAGELTAEQRDYVQIVMEKGDQLLQIINGILDLSKIESGTLRLHCESVALASLLDKARRSLEPQARRRKLRLAFDLPDALPPLVADRAKVLQVVLNLLSNAVKFTPAGGGVTLSVAAAGVDGPAAEPLPGIEIRVRDTGPGVPEEARERIFEAFQQLDAGATRQYGGTGLGLSIARHFVRAHGGRIWVEDAPGGGALFVVRLPLEPPEGCQAAAALARAAG